METVRKRIILIEDDDINQGVISSYVAKDYDVDVIPTGEEAIEAVKSTSYDIILLDINLGEGIDGLKTLEMIREIKGYSDIPVVAVTAYALPGDRERMLNAGCDFYIAKPFYKRELLEILEKIK
ncbi:MAG: response regulator [Ignavibacteriaceae bacterium]|nr:response regulator [Ignavibacteriaceae bacterium]NUM70395.1 response regulator [Ignavibacteriaceae bacterium]